MKLKTLLRAYGLWLAGVLSAAAAAYFLFRSRAISYELAGDEYPLDVDDLEAAGLQERIEDYLPAGDELPG